MGGAIRLNLHCHSNLSDGLLSPEDVANRLADAGAVVAALTDHDTVAGSGRFREALSLRGVAFIDAVELTTFCDFGEIHLLGFGIDPDSSELGAALQAIAGTGDAELRTFMERIRRRGARPHAGKLETAAAIELIHRAGGIAVIAHPLDIPFTTGDLEQLLDSPAAAGLDGLEAWYGPYSAEQRAYLGKLAEDRDLCSSMGTDFHQADDPAHRPVIEVEEDAWRAFRDRLLRQKPGPREATAVAPTAPSREVPAHASDALRHPPQPRFRLGVYSVRVIAAALVSLGLFILALFAFSIPYFERTLLERKKDLIRELTAEAVSLIAEYEADERTGRSTRKEAQEDAITHIRDIRYGREGKDYFWITDLTPRMLMHPYRKDLEGQDLSDFRDDNGLRVFYEFARAVRQENEGYVEYLWQWKDDADRIVPKLSYVKRFDPWGWIIGTGIYLDDVEKEIHGLTARMVWLSVCIALILAVLLAYIARQSVRIEQEKHAADFAVRESKERYRALVEASSEGMVIVIDGACTFANAPFLELSGYAEPEIVLVGISELIVPYKDEEEAVIRFLATLPKNSEDPPTPRSEVPSADRNASLACLLRRRSGELVDVVLRSSSFTLAGKRGVILTVKDARIGEAAIVDTRGPAAAAWDPRTAEIAGIAFFRARLNRRALILSADALAARFLGLDADERTGLLDRLVDDRAWEAARAELIGSGKLIRRPLRLRGLPSADGRYRPSRVYWLSARAETAGADDDNAASGATSGATSGAKSGGGGGAGSRVFSAILETPPATGVADATSDFPGGSAHADASAAVAAAAAGAEDFEALGHAREASLSRALAAARMGLRASLIEGELSAANDAIVARLCRFAETELGPPPCRYAFLVLGSGGRSELLPPSDQDNAIVFSPPSGVSRGGVAHSGVPERAYFLRLGKFVCDALRDFGTPECPGGVMAKNEAWCAPLPDWRSKFGRWIAVPDSVELLSLNLSFDFRSVYGDHALAAELRAAVFATLARTPAFFTHLAKDCLRRRAVFPPAAPLFGPGAGDGEVDIKDLGAQFVMYARLYALREGIAETNTDRRLRALGERDVFDGSLARDCADARETLAGFRALRADTGPAGVKIPLAALSPFDEANIRAAYAVADLVQKKIAFDFPGAGM